MSKTKCSVLVKHHLKSLKLPTFGLFSDFRGSVVAA